MNHVSTFFDEAKQILSQVSVEAHGVDLPSSYLVGDRWRDIEAGQAVGCKTVLVDNGYPQEKYANPSIVVSSLPEAVTWILRQEEQGA